MLISILTRKINVNHHLACIVTGVCVYVRVAAQRQLLAHVSCREPARARAIRRHCRARSV